MSVAPGIAGAEKLRALAAIGDVPREGFFVYYGGNAKNSHTRVGVVAARSAVTGENFFVSVGARDDVNGRLFYDHELMEMERAGRLSSQWGVTTKGNSPRPPAQSNDFTAAFCGQDANVSKVVDEQTGEPLRGQSMTIQRCVRTMRNFPSIALNKVALQPDGLTWQHGLVRSTRLQSARYAAMALRSIRRARRG